MSMYRQLWLALILSTLLAAVGCLFASTLSARSYLQEQLRMKNADNAAALALSLSHKNVDPVEIELAVSALFDSGHYESIHVFDPFGKTLTEKHANVSDYEAPSWFLVMFPIVAPAGEAQIANGWKQIGSVSLMSHSRFAYHALWDATMKIVTALAFAGLLGGYLGTLVLRRLQRPLEAVIDQARAITERRFIIIPEPKVPELRQLSSAMNSVVLRLKGMFDEEAGRLEIIRREANNDALTGLVNRRYFMAQLRAQIESEENAGGSLMLIRVAHLADLNRHLGRNATDSHLKSISRVIKTFATRFPEGLAARLNGADFGLILPSGEARLIADELLTSIVQETSYLLQGEPVAFIGIGQFHYGLNLGALLAQIDSALAGAEASGINCVREAITFYANNLPHSTEEWAQQLRSALAQGKAQLASFPVIDFSQRVIHRECPLRLMLSEEGEWMPAGRFMPIVERLGLTVSVDIAAITLGLAELSANSSVQDLAINISARSIQDESFRKQVRVLLESQPQATRRLWLEVSENGAFAHFDAFRVFRRELIDCGCRIGLEHFGRQFSQIGRLHDMGLDYLKIDACFIRGIEDNPGNQVFLKGLSSMAHSIGLKVFAESVVSLDELHMLSSLAFDGATGPFIQEPKH